MSNHPDKQKYNSLLTVLKTLNQCKKLLCIYLVMQTLLNCRKRLQILGVNNYINTASVLHKWVAVKNLPPLNLFLGKPRYVGSRQGLLEADHNKVSITTEFNTRNSTATEQVIPTSGIFTNFK